MSYTGKEEPEHTPAPFIIGLTGSAGCGKSTISNIIQQLDPRFQCKSFAAPIKEMCALGLGLGYDQIEGEEKEVPHPVYGVSPRHIMQTLGTDWGRSLIHPDIWVLRLEQNLASHTLISDVRFENEAELVRKYGALIHIEGRVKKLGGTEEGHSSEGGVSRKKEDYTFFNAGATLQGLEDNLKILLDCILDDCAKIHY